MCLRTLIVHVCWCRLLQLRVQDGPNCSMHSLQDAGPTVALCLMTSVPLSLRASVPHDKRASVPLCLMTSVRTTPKATLCLLGLSAPSGMRFRDVRAPALRSHLQLAHHQQGIMVTAINSTSAAAGIGAFGPLMVHTWSSHPALLYLSRRMAWIVTAQLQAVLVSPEHADLPTQGLPAQGCAPRVLVEAVAGGLCRDRALRYCKAHTLGLVCTQNARMLQ